MERTDIDELLARLEDELRLHGRASADTDRSGELLPVGLRRALAPALAFVGGSDVPAPDPDETGTAPPLPRHVRLAMARITLLRLAVHTGRPRWSAGLLADVFALADALPGGDVGDIPDAMSTLLIEPPLTQELADFLGGATGLWMRRYPEDYARYDFALLTSRLVRSGAPALACFAALSLPPDQLRRHRAHILRALPRGPHRYTAVSLIETRGAP